MVSEEGSKVDGYARDSELEGELLLQPWKADERGSLGFEEEGWKADERGSLGFEKKGWKADERGSLGFEEGWRDEGGEEPGSEEGDRLLGQGEAFDWAMQEFENERWESVSPSPHSVLVDLLRAWCLDPLKGSLRSQRYLGVAALDQIERSELADRGALELPTSLEPE